MKRALLSPRAGLLTLLAAALLTGTLSLLVAAPTQAQSTTPATVTLSANPAQVWEGQSSRITATLSHALPHDVYIPVHVSPCPENSWCNYLHSSKNRTIQIFAGRTTGSLRVPHPVSGVFTRNQQQQGTDAKVWGPYVSLLTFRDADAEHEEVTVSLKSSLPNNVRAGGKTSQKITVLDPDGFAMTITADKQPAEGGGVVKVTVDLGQPAPDGFVAKINSSASTAKFGYSHMLDGGFRVDWGMEGGDVQVEAGDASAGPTLPRGPGPPPCSRYTGNPPLCTEYISADDWHGRDWRRMHYLKDWNGASKKTFTIRVADDDFVDPGETIVLQGIGHLWPYWGIDFGRSGFPKGQVQSNELRLTIKDNDGDAAADAPILMGALPTIARESGTGDDSTARMQVWLSRPATQKVTVRYSTQASTATADVDFTNISATALTFEPGETRKEIEITIKDDNVEDSGESFALWFTDVEPTTVARWHDGSYFAQFVTVTIINDEADLEGLKLWGAAAADAPFAALDIGTFDRNKTNYAVTVPHGTTHAKIAGIEPQDTYLKLKAGIAGLPLTAVNSGVASPALALAVGDTIVEVQATAPSGERKTYRVTVTRQAPADGPPTVAFPIADLDGLRVGKSRQISLAGVFSYDGDGALTITARSSDTGVADVTVAADQSALTVSGVAEGTATITVTADDGNDGSVEDAFTVAVTPAPSGPEPTNVQIVAGDGAATVSWTVSPFYYKGRLIEGERIMHALRWWVGSGWANPVGEKGFGRNDGIHVENGVTSYTITGLTNGVAVEANVRAFFGSNYQEGAMNKGESSTSSRWVSSGVATPTEPNNAPTVASAISDATIVNESGTSQVSLSGVFTDADGDDLTVTATSSDETVATASVSADYATLTVSAQARGTATITVTADDGAATVDDTFTVTVKAAPVVANAIADVSELAVDATHEVTMSGVFSDADGDSLTVTASSSNDAVATVAVAADHSGLTLTGKGAGTAAITVTAQDSDGNTVSDAFDVTVVNSAPTVSSAIADATIVNQSGTHQVSLSGVFSDADEDSLTVTATSSDETVATVSVAADYATLTVSAKARGTATITVAAKDGNGGSVEDAFSVKVKAAPTVASAIADIGSLIAGTSQEVALTSVFSDADNDTLTPSASSSATAVATVSVATDGSSLTVTGVAEGAATITVTAQDADGNTVSDAFDVTVIKVNNPPTVASAIDDATIVNQSGTSQVSLSGVFSDADGDDLTITATSSDEQAATVSVSADYSTLTVSAQSRGSANVTVTASDGNGGSVEDTFTVTVKAAPVVASAIADVSALEIDATHEVSMSDVFSDADGDALTISATTSDSAVAQVSNTIDPSTGSATAITVTGVDAGTATITVTARDSDGNSVSDAFDVTVPAAEQQEQAAELPGPVVGLELTASADNSVTVSWQAPATGGAPDGYIVHLRPEDGKQGSGKTKRPKAKKTQVKFNNLQSGQTYEVWVRAQNEAGKGERVHASITLPEEGDSQSGQ